MIDSYPPRCPPERKFRGGGDAKEVLHSRLGDSWDDEGANRSTTDARLLAIDDVNQALEGLTSEVSSSGKDPGAEHLRLADSLGVSWREQASKMEQ